MIFDYSNAEYYDTQLDALCDMIRQMRFEGFKSTSKSPSSRYTLSGKTATHLYNTLYGPGNYSDLWYYWQGKPLILGYVNGSGGSDTVPSTTVQNFFTWRTPGRMSPRTSFTMNGSGLTRPRRRTGATTRAPICPKNCPSPAAAGPPHGNLGNSHSNNSQPDYDNYHLPLQHTSRLGIFFKEQMNYGLKYDPQFLFITQWNEWIAGSFARADLAVTRVSLADCCPVGGFYFVDEYNEEYSRDIEPMKGGHTDNYYFQMVGQNRLRKGRPAGARPPARRRPSIWRAASRNGPM